jgi:16S rRNA (adenine1518-N6/adenine1519-N6)-dimethyltransferase
MKLPLPTADKSLGQHFLKDQNVIKRITSDFDGIIEAAVEIGPGPGILTESLAERATKDNLPFFVIEKDERFPEYLRQFITNDQITLTDALAVNLQDFFAEKGILGKKIWLVSNLPYNISTPLLVNFLQAPDIRFMTLMFQKEVADKVFPFATTRNFMGSLHALSMAFFDCELLLKVPPGAFNPPPKVDSAVLTMKRKENPLVPLSEFNQYEKFLRKLFAQKRKQLGGLLKSSFDQALIAKSFEELSIPLTIRAEALTLDQVIDLYRKLKK